LSSSISAAPPASKRSAREIYTAMSGLIVAMFVAVLSGTVISTSLPVIVSNLHGTQSQYTWVVTASLLATAVSTPIWGKLADLVNRKVLIQAAIALYVVGTVIAGFSTDATMLIAMRVVQGLGAGGLMSLVMIAVALIISPRERGKYMGLVGGIMSLATIGGPLLGGVLTDLWGWRSNFFICVPVAIIAMILLQFTLHLPKPSRDRKVSIDYVGVVLMGIGISLLLVWVSMGHSATSAATTGFGWTSGTGLTLIITAAAALVAFVVVEFFAKEPILPMGLFKNRTFTLASIAALGVGIALYATSVFLAQYFQLARGVTPTRSGLMTIPLIIGQVVASILIGQLVSRLGKWKIWMVIGSVLTIAGFALLSTIRYDTSFTLVAAYMVVIGLGLGMVMQNLTLVVQNDTPVSQLGAASANVNFFRTIAGTIGVTVMGTMLASKVGGYLTSGLTGYTPKSQREVSALKELAGGDVPATSSLPGHLRTIVESAYGHGIADTFIIVVPLAFLALIAIVFLRNKKLSNKTAIESMREQAEDEIIDLAEAEVGASATEAIAAIRANGIGTEPLATGSIAVLESEHRSDENRAD